MSESDTKRRDTEDWDFLTNLVDELLLEILLRLLPDRRSVFRCTAVNKRCYSLLSTHYSEFARRCSLPYTLLFECRVAQRRKRTDPPRSKNKWKVFPDFSLEYLTYQVFSDESKSLHHGSSSSSSSSSYNYLNFLPLRPKVKACFGDLLLVSKSFSLSKYYYICNPVTRKYVALPRALKSMAEKFGLVFRRDRDHLVENNNYRVVLISYPGVYDNPHEFVAQIFCSETRKWREFIVESPKPFSCGIGITETVKVVACNGILYWVDGSHCVTGIVAFDPFDEITEPKRCRYIDPPEKWMRHVCLGECKGRLRLSNFVLDCGYQVLRVWELMDGADHRHSWCLQHDVRIARMEKLSHVLAFHPTDCDIVFLFNDGLVFRCHLGLREDKNLRFTDEKNLRLTDEKKVGEFPVKMSRVHHPDFDVSVFPLLHPFRPTQVPSLASI